MTIKNLFIPKTLLPTSVDLIIESFLIIELNEVDSLEGF